jgi:hypothetical protein
VLSTRHTISVKVGTNFADKPRSLGRYSSITDPGQGVYFGFFNGIGIYILHAYKHVAGACGSIVVKALCYKPEGRGFDTR